MCPHELVQIQEGLVQAPLQNLVSLRGLKDLIALDNRDYS